MKNSNHDPKLKLAAEEIKQILKEHDIQASMMLASPSHVEYLFHFDASWSVMRFEAAPDGSDRPYLRIRSKKEDFVSKEAQNEATEATVHGITSFLQFGRMCQANMEEILKKLQSHMSIAYKVWD